MDQPLKSGTATRDIVNGVGKALAIIELFNEDRRRMTITDAANLTDLTRAAARRYLLSLVHLGYAEFDGKFFSLTSRVMRLGHAYLAATPLTQRLQPYLDRIAQAGHPCLAAVIDGLDAVCVAQATPLRTMFTTLRVGSRIPAYRWAVGRVLLAFSTPDALDAYWANVHFEAVTPRSITTRSALEEQLALVRQQGFAAVAEEVEAGLTTVAVPVRDARDAVVAAVSLATRGAMPTGDARKELLGILAPVQGALQQVA